MSIQGIKADLKSHSDPQKAQLLQGFFKTGPGEYGEGDIFIGVMVPDTRAVVKKHVNMDLKEVVQLLKSKIHEERLAALLILVAKYAKAEEKDQARIYKIYLANTKHINNWDLVDLSAYRIVGPFLINQDKKPLYVLAKSKSLWERRIAVLATFHFINQKKYSDALKIAKILLEDEEDLIHKAVGWMLREIGKRDLAVEEVFLKKHYQRMPRTMLRYAIERFPESKRQAYLKGTI